MLKNIWILNRPVAPHLSVYMFQASSLASIWHRFAGIFLITFLLVFNFELHSILYFKVSVTSSNFLVIFLNLNKYIFFVFLVIFLYHAFNGVRYVLYSLNYILKIESINIFLYVILVVLLIILMINLVNI